MVYIIHKLFRPQTSECFIRRAYIRNFLSGFCFANKNVVGAASSNKLWDFRKLKCSSGSLQNSMYKQVYVLACNFTMKEKPKDSCNIFIRLVMAATKVCAHYEHTRFWEGRRRCAVLFYICRLNICGLSWLQNSISDACASIRHVNKKIVLI